MAVTAVVTDIIRSLNTLHGILLGISCDNVFNTNELNELNFWLTHHKYLDSIYPVYEITQIIDSVIKSGFMDNGTKNELIEYCTYNMTEDNNVFNNITKDAQALHGFLQGIISDKKVTHEELNALRNWLRYHSDHLDKWPFNSISSLVSEILSDNVISKDEEIQFIEFAKEFTEEIMAEGIVDKSIFINQWMMNDSPAFKTIQHIIDDVDFSVSGNTFCFTGQMKSMKRIEAKQMVESNGGIFIDHINHKTNYLVIGALSNPAWAYSTYGRKIESVMRNRDSGVNTMLLSENKFLSSIK